MNINVDLKDIKFNKSSVAPYWVKYKSYGLYILIFVICILLVSQFLIPQFQEFLVSKDEEKQYEKRIETLRGNIQFLTGLDERKLDTQVESLSAALPIEKDFAGIINAISTASNRSGVVIGDFSFSLGDLAVKSSDGDAAVLITLKVNGSAQAVRSFMKDLSEMVPRTDITSIRYSEGSASLLTSFLYRPPSSIKFNSTLPLKPLSTSDLAIVAMAEKWKGNVGSLFDFFPGVVTPSPTPTPTPTPVVVVTPSVTSAPEVLTPTPTTPVVSATPTP
jgi:hypothetical protein